MHCIDSFRKCLSQFFEPPQNIVNSEISLPQPVEKVIDLESSLRPVEKIAAVIHEEFEKWRALYPDSGMPKTIKDERLHKFDRLSITTDFLRGYERPWVKGYNTGYLYDVIPHTICIHPKTECLEKELKTKLNEIRDVEIISFDSVNELQGMKINWAT